MSRFLVDGFGGNAGASITARPPDVGGPWQQLSAAAIMLTPLTRARGSGNTLARCVSAGAPETADYDVAGTTIQQTAVGEWNVMLRADAASDTCYAVGYTAGAWLIRRIVNGAATTLATVAAPWANNEIKPWRAKIRGTNPVTIELRDALLGGNVILSASDANAARLTSAGLVGLRINGGAAALLDQRGYHVGRLSAAAIPVDARPRAPKPADGPLAARVAAAADRRVERARVLAEAGAPAPWQVTRNGVTYTVTLPSGVSFDGRGLLAIPRIDVTPAPPRPLDPPYLITNPPLLTPDGTVRESPDDQGDPEIVPNYREDTAEAIRQIVADAVL